MQVGTFVLRGRYVWDTSRNLRQHRDPSSSLTSHGTGTGRKMMWMLWICMSHDYLRCRKEVRNFFQTIYLSLDHVSSHCVVQNFTPRCWKMSPLPYQKRDQTHNMVLYPPPPFTPSFTPPPPYFTPLFPKFPVHRPKGGGGKGPRIGLIIFFAPQKTQSQCSQSTLVSSAEIYF